MSKPQKLFFKSNKKGEDEPNNIQDNLNFLMSAFPILMDRRSKIATTNVNATDNLLVNPNEVIDMEAKAIFKGSN